MDDWAEGDPDEGPHRPLVTERFRRLGWLAVVLVPLLALTLSQVAWRTEWAIIVLIGGLVAISALGERDRDDRDDSGDGEDATG